MSLVPHSAAVVQTEIFSMQQCGPNREVGSRRTFSASSKLQGTREGDYEWRRLICLVCPQGMQQLTHLSTSQEHWWAPADEDKNPVLQVSGADALFKAWWSWLVSGDLRQVMTITERLVE